MRKLLFLSFLFLSHFSFGQTEEEIKYWATWNKNYPEIDVIDLLKFERRYADSVERHQEIIPYFTRFEKYSFRAEFLGQIRPMNPDVLKSMKRVSTLFGGNPSQLDQLTGSEVLFRIGDEDIWMEIQPNILSALKEEVAKGDKPKIYCSFFNEHTSQNKLYNTFLISEFVK